MTDERVGISTMYLRFSLVHRLVHAGLMVGFLAAALTGLPLRFSTQPWAAVVWQLLGGAPVARLVHRGAALLLALCAVVHVGTLVYLKIWRRHAGLFWGPDSLVPQPHDWRELWQHLRWLRGKGPLPQFERWTYWQKFDYWAAVLGMLSIGSTGLIVWLGPRLSSWLPGWVITLSLWLHGHEAVLAVGVISVFHFFHAHLRPGKFPVDTAIFTGRVQEARLHRDHKRYYTRLQATGQLSRLQVLPAPPWYERLIRYLWVIPVGLCWLLWLLVLWSIIRG